MTTSDGAELESVCCCLEEEKRDLKRGLDFRPGWDLELTGLVSLLPPLSGVRLAEEGVGDTDEAEPAEFGPPHTQPTALDAQPPQEEEEDEEEEPWS